MAAVGGRDGTIRVGRLDGSPPHLLVGLLSADPGEMDTQMHAQALPDADRSTLASPSAVAAPIADLVERAESVPSGSRVEFAAQESLA